MRRLRGTYLVCILLACALYAVGLVANLSLHSSSAQPSAATSGTSTTGTPIGPGSTPTGTTTGTPTGTTGSTGTAITVTSAVAALQEGHGFLYETLTEEQQALYDLELQAAQEPGTTVQLPSADAEDVDAAFQAVCNDHPECFWLEGYEYTGNANGLSFSTKLNTDEAEIPAVQAEIEREAQTFLSTLDEDASTYERVRATYEWIIERTEYEENDDDQNLKGVFLDRAAVCAGYARSFEYLCHLQGIPCAAIVGKTNDGESHVWCLVEIDGTPTYVDPTWGDPTYKAADASAYGNGIIYDYLCITTEEMYRDRTSTVPLESLPLCDSTEYDYYRLEGLFLEEYGQDAVDGFLADAVAAGEPSVRFKLGSKEAYDQALAYLESDEVFEGALNGIDSVSWYCEDDLYIIDAFWK